MRRFVTVLSLILALCTLLCLGACGGKDADSSGDEPSADTSAADSTVESVVSELVSETSDESSAPDGKVEYKVAVTDADGKAMAGVMVQLCLNTCCPGVTDADGVASFKLEAADYKVSVMTMPEGYTYASEETEFHFEEGSTELTITLKTAE
ncbi:MAG: hypothetical protein IKK83_02150 [Clostridia bacterium]|nr:hypothetical protein [Clostridia bacterium]